MVGSTLELTRVSPTEAGPYTCRAANAHGTDEKTFSVIVLGKIIVTIKFVILRSYIIFNKINEIFMFDSIYFFLFFYLLYDIYVLNSNISNTPRTYNIKIKYH